MTALVGLRIGKEFLAKTTLCFFSLLVAALLRGRGRGWLLVRVGLRGRWCAVGGVATSCGCEAEGAQRRSTLALAVAIAQSVGRDVDGLPARKSNHQRVVR